MKSSLSFRPFIIHDAEFCFKVRSRAFIEKFYGELSPREIVVCVNAYMPADYIRLSKEMPFFIVEALEKPVGFFTLEQINFSTAELALIYIDVDHIGEGIGSACVQFLEQWLIFNWSEVKDLIVRTIIPKYNGGFYRKLGFKPEKEIFCDYPGLSINALQLRKTIHTQSSNRH